MNRGEIKVLEALLQGVQQAEDIAACAQMSIPQVYRNLKKLMEKGFVEKTNSRFQIASSELFFTLKRVAVKYDLEALFRGRGLDLLMLLACRARGFEELTKKFRLAESTLYGYLSRLMQVGAVAYEDGKYTIADRDLLQLLQLLEVRRKALLVEPFAEIIYTGESFLLKRVPSGMKARGSLTAFSLFSKYGITLHLPYNYYVDPPMEESLETALVHALIAASTRRERTLCALLYAKNRSKLNLAKAHQLARGTPALPLLLKLEYYAAGLPVEDPEAFLPWNEFLELAELYGVKVEKPPSAEVLDHYFREVGVRLQKPIEAYVFGGLNLVLLKVKEATKDVDLVVGGEEEFKAFINALEQLGYKPLGDIEFFPEDLRRKPCRIYCKDSLRIDIFLEKIAGKLLLTEGMKKRAEKGVAYGNLTLKFMSLEDIILLKACSPRERDLEDIAAIAKKSRISWRELVKILLEQPKEVAEEYAFAVLQTLETLEEAYKVRTPRSVRAQLRKMALRNLVRKALEMGYRTPSEISKRLGYPASQVRKILQELRCGERDSTVPKS